MMNDYFSYWVSAKFNFFSDIFLKKWSSIWQPPLQVWFYIEIIKISYTGPYLWNSSQLTKTSKNKNKFKHKMKSTYFETFKTNNPYQLTGTYHS